MRRPPACLTVRKLVQVMVKVAGMALQNGLLVHTVENWAAAIRGADGTIQVASGPKPSRMAAGWAGRWPLLRGVAQMGDALALLPLVKSGWPAPCFRWSLLEWPRP